MEKDAAKTRRCPLFKWNVPFYNRKKKLKEESITDDVSTKDDTDNEENDVDETNDKE